MKMETVYELLVSYEDFLGKIPAGTRMTEPEWIARCGLITPNTCMLLTNWFKEVLVPIYNEYDIIEFANYIIKRNFPKEDTGYELYHKWKAMRN